MGVEYLQQHSLKTKDILDKEHCESSNNFELVSKADDLVDMTFCVHNVLQGNKPRDSNTHDDEESVIAVKPISTGKRRHAVNSDELVVMEEKGLDLNGIKNEIRRDELVSPLTIGTRIERYPFIADHAAVELEDMFASSLAVSYLVTVVVIVLVGSAGFYLFRFADPVK